MSPPFPAPQRRRVAGKDRWGDELGFAAQARGVAQGSVPARVGTLCTRTVRFVTCLVLQQERTEEVCKPRQTARQGDLSPQAGGTSSCSCSACRLRPPWEKASCCAAQPFPVPAPQEAGEPRAAAATGEDRFPRTPPGASPSPRVHAARGITTSWHNAITMGTLGTDPSPNRSGATRSSPRACRGQCPAPGHQTSTAQRPCSSAMSSCAAAAEPAFQRAPPHAPSRSVLGGHHTSSSRSDDFDHAELLSVLPNSPASALHWCQILPQTMKAVCYRHPRRGKEPCAVSSPWADFLPPWPVHGQSKSGSCSRTPQQLEQRIPGRHRHASDGRTRRHQM